jgi:glycosyltransferase involved in cell wall biosynthesis
MVSQHDVYNERICFVIPCYNEEGMVGHFYRALRDEIDKLDDLQHHILFIDDGSTDATLAELNRIAEQDDSVAVYSLSRNFGHQIALSAGLDFAQGDAVLMMDCDLQHPPQLVAGMVEQWRNGSDIVSAVRLHTQDASLFKRFSSQAFYWLINRLSETRIAPGVADFCLLSKPAHLALRAMPERHRFLRGMIAWIGFKRTYITFEAPPRAMGRSKYTTLKMLGLALDALFSFSTAPIKLATRFGVGIVMLGVAYLIYILGRYFFVGDLVPGWGSLICTLMLLGGTQLVFVGLIGEYIARVFEEAKGRPLYVLKQRPGEIYPPIMSPASNGATRNDVSQAQAIGMSSTT